MGRDLIKLERIALQMTTADICTKQMGPLLFWRYCDYLMGRVPPQYLAHYQNLHLLTNLVRLGGQESESDSVNGMD